jgi:Ribonuclease G/E
MTAAVTAILIDLRDLEAMLHILGDAAEGRGDEDSRRALRLLARHAERLEEQLERLGAAGCTAEEKCRCQS